MVYQNSPPTKDWTSKKFPFVCQSENFLSEGQTFGIPSRFPLWKFKTHFSKEPSPAYAYAYYTASQSANSMSGVLKNMARKINISEIKNMPCCHYIFFRDDIFIQYETRNWDSPWRVPTEYIRFVRIYARGWHERSPSTRDIRFSSRETFHRLSPFGNPGLKKGTPEDSPSLALGFGTLYSETKRPTHWEDAMDVKADHKYRPVAGKSFSPVVSRCFQSGNSYKSNVETRRRWKRNASLARISL